MSDLSPEDIAKIVDIIVKQYVSNFNPEIERLQQSFDAFEARWEGHLDRLSRDVFDLRRKRSRKRSAKRKHSMAKMSKSTNASKAPIKKATKLPPMAAKAKAKGGAAPKMGYGKGC